MKLSTLFGILILGLSLNSHALTVISDLDDTIKITHVKTLENYYNSIIGTQVFLGMDELVRSYQANNAKVIVLSGSPEILRPAVNRLMNVNHFTVDDLYLAGKPEKKFQILVDLAQTLNDELILIGDDQEFDPAYYQELKAKFPDKVKAIYIHQVNNRPTLTGQIGFVTAYEVALHENRAGRLSNGSVQNVKEQIQNRLNLAPQDPYVTQRVSEELIPRWNKCLPNPSPLKTIDGDTEFLQQLEGILQRNCKPN